MFFWSGKCKFQSPSKSLLRFPSGRETAKKKLETTNHFPTKPDTPRARSGPERISVAYGNIPAPGVGR